MVGAAAAEKRLLFRGDTARMRQLLHGGRGCKQKSENHVMNYLLRHVLIHLLLHSGSFDIHFDIHFSVTLPVFLPVAVLLTHRLMVLKMEGQVMPL